MKFSSTFLLPLTYFLTQLTQQCHSFLPHNPQKLPTHNAKPLTFTKKSDTTLKAIEGADPNFLANAWDSYNVALDTNPLITKSVTAGIILGAADFAGQSIENKMKKEKLTTESNDTEFGIELARVLRFAFFGLVLQAPWNHFYYQILDGALPPTEDPFTQTTGIKVVIDQFIQAPIFTVLIFAFLGTLEGKTLEQVKTQLGNDYTDTMVANCEYSLTFYFRELHTI